MAVSKRLRFEILRRDNHTCRYCGRKAPDVPLRVDHVVPVALGGTDDPTNLVTSCEGCNSGKSSTVPDSPLVAQAREDAMRWQMAWAIAVAEAEAEGQQRAKDIATVKQHYTAAYKGRHGALPILPEGWESSVGRWLDLGLPLTLIDKAIASAVGRDKVPADKRFAYFAGCCWSLLRELQDRTEQIAKQADATSEGNAEDAGAADDASLLDRVEESFAHGWTSVEQPDPYCQRMLAAYAQAASAAGYDWTTIEHAAFSAARDGHGDISVYLRTIDDVLAAAADPHHDSPFGALSIDADLLPSDADRVAWSIAECAVAVWRKAWREAGQDLPPAVCSSEVQTFREAAQDAYRESGDAGHLLSGAEWAGAEGRVNLATAIEEAKAHNVTELAVSVWGEAFTGMTGAPAGPLVNDVWRDLYTLHAGTSWPHQIIVAAAFAGIHGTTRLHFGIDPGEAGKLGVDPFPQLCEDLWAQTWFGSQSPHMWPTEDQRAEFRAHLVRLREQDGGRDQPLSFCVRAGAYRETNPDGHQGWSMAGMLRLLEANV